MNIVSSILLEFSKLKSCNDTFCQREHKTFENVVLLGGTTKDFLGFRLVEAVTFSTFSMVLPGQSCLC